MRYLIPIFAIILVACGESSNEVSDQEKIRDEVRNYLFLEDSVEVAANIVDTILVEELDGMLMTIEDNLFKVQMDIDTLNSMIDSVAYQNMRMREELNLYPESEDMKMAPHDLKLANYQLKMADLEATKKTFQQSKRVMLHLRRSQLNSIAGYEIVVNYESDGRAYELGFIMNTDFKIID